MSLPILDEQRVAWDLRTAWGTGRHVRVTLTERCALRTIVGKVTRVSVTGAFAVIDGWHVPCAEVMGLGKPTLEDSEAYERALSEAPEY